MTNDKYSVVRDFVNKGIKLPKTKQETLAIAKVFHNHEVHHEVNVDVKEASEHTEEVQCLTALSHPWKERREALRSQQALCKEVLCRLIELNLIKIGNKDLNRLRIKKITEQEFIAS